MILLLWAPKSKADEGFSLTQSSLLKKLGSARLISFFALRCILYIDSRDPAYHQSLSLASQGTLINQGGPMSPDEAVAFERHPDFLVLIEMRKWDDKAKNKEIPPHSNTFYKDLCRKILLSEKWKQIWWMDSHSRKYGQGLCKVAWQTKYFKLVAWAAPKITQPFKRFP